MFTKTLSLLFSLLLICATSLSAQTIRYVSTMGANADPATANSWANSTANLQAAINSLSATGGEVWVAAGTYKPTTSTDRTISFSLRNGVTIYGGFPTSGNPGLAERSPASFTTTLSGDIGVVGSIDDNSYHVLFNPGSLSLTATAVLDGFVVTAGNANGPGKDYNAGGMYNDGSNGSVCSPTVQNCNFLNNINGGLLNVVSNGGISSPTLTNCSFTGNINMSGISNSAGFITKDGVCNPVLTNCSFTRNSCWNGGGGMYNVNSNPVLINCSFTQNGGPAFGSGLGGGMYNEYSSPLLLNCKFTDNLGFRNGGGMYSLRSSPVLINCSFVGNLAGAINPGFGGGICNGLGSQTQLINCSFSNNKADAGGRAIYSETGSGTTQLTNCILWSNSGNKTFSGTGISVNYSLMEPTVSGYTDGGHNLTTTTSPFVSDTDLRLKAGALAINTGSATAYSAASGPASDLGGSTRIQGLIDMGAYESSFVPDVIPILYTLPSTQYGTSTFSVVVDVFELNSVPTQGLVTVYITKDPLVSLNFNGASTTVGGRDVQNGSWTFDGVSNDNAYILTSTQAIEATGKKSFGLTGIGTPGNSKGSLTITTAIANINGEEVKVTNNNDADKIDYFKQ